jgi:DNA-binding GntR family transcriptional regulator
LGADKNTTLSEKIYKELMNQICTGQISTDTTLTESIVVQMFEVSKAPVREALIKLCHENVLESHPRKGYRVRPISPKDISEISEMRLFLELNSLQRINANLDSKSIYTLRKLSDDRIRIIEDNKTVWQLWDNNIEFHLKLNKIAGNVYIYNSLAQCISTCTRAYAQVYASNHKTMYPNSDKSRHDFIVDALEQHDMFTAYFHLKEDILFLQTLLLQRHSLQSLNHIKLAE